MSIRLCRVFIGGLALVIGGCSSNGGVTTGPGSGVAETGGMTSNGTGGASTNGGSTINSVGGMATGGAASTSGTATGGNAVSTGGLSSTGGTVSTGGLSSTGGKASTGGSASTGGKASTGGSASTGGKASTGGSASTGGKSSTGGTSSTGGKSSTGGTSSTGGSASTGGSSGSTCAPSSTQFSFFVTSRARLFALAQELNGSTKGFGGDLRYGQTGTGAGLLGADKICTEIAEASMPGNCKEWHAFLSTSTGSAIDRIGPGPWYDRLGRLFANDTSGLKSTRPLNANTTIINNLPNEDGVLHHLEETNSSGSAADNHDILTGTNDQGALYGANSACSDWTSTSTSIKPRCGHTWPTGGGGGGGGNPGGGTGCGMSHWMCALDEAGCAPGYNLVESGGPGNDGTVGSGGGYGGIYCFAKTP